jgi:hypothetical protein
MLGGSIRREGDLVAHVADSTTRDGGVAQATGDLMKSVGRFSLAMGLFAARQTGRFLSAPGAKATTSFDEVTSAAGGQLTGIVKTAFAVGANLQSGLVDAAFDAAGIGARGQEPAGSTDGLKMSLKQNVERRWSGIQTVASGATDRPVPQAELLRRLAEYRTEAMAGAPDRVRSVRGLWKSEGLATTIAKHRLPGNALNDPALPRQVLPVTHVGFGSGSSELVMFDAPRLNAIFAECCAANYQEFAYEGVGAMLRAYERGFFKLLTGTLGFIRLDTPDGPNPSGFFADYLKQFPPRIQRVIGHGYGRILAFSHVNVYDAIREATTLPHGRIEPVVHGVGFAFAMMNSADLPRILRQSAVPFDRAVRAAFQNGLIYALVFAEWFAPGVLAAWQPEGALETELIARARDESALDLERGFPLAGRLAQPRA